MKRFLATTRYAPLLMLPLLFFAAVLLAQMLDSKDPEPAFDMDLYKYHKSFEVTSLDDLVEDFEVQQFQWLPIWVPSTESFGWTQAADPLPIPFVPDKFPQSFLDGLIPALRDGVTVYPVTVWEDPSTRERVLVNADGKEIAAVPAPADYDPAWCLQGVAPDTRAMSDDYVAWLAQVYEPSHLLIRYELILEEDLIKWVYARSMKENAAKAASLGSGGGIMMAYNGPPVTAIKFTAMERTNGYIRLTVAYPWQSGNPTNSYTNRLEFFACTNLLTFEWTSLGTTNVSSSTNWIEWNDTQSLNYPIRFYAAANADLTPYTDPDGDGLTWGREHHPAGELGRGCVCLHVQLCHERSGRGYQQA